MPPFLTEMDSDTGFVTADIDDRGRSLNESYRNAKPFPHIVIDDFLPTPVVENCLRNFPNQRASGDIEYNRDQERFKTSFNPDTLASPLRTLFYSFNSKPFIQVLENITGIEGLIPDPYFLGAGFHEVANGGHLSIHVDFNHHTLMDLERRINVLIYLNKDWEESFGGQLELWNPDMTTSVQTVLPVFNRCVIFNTTEDSYHGNPNPVAAPDGRSRKSIALYYYTSTWSDEKRSHTTQFRARRGTGDKPDLHVRARELVADITPPALLRALRQVKRIIPR